MICSSLVVVVSFEYMFLTLTDILLARWFNGKSAYQPAAGAGFEPRTAQLSQLDALAKAPMAGECSTRLG